ncbi:MAG: c-type cytochrome [Candidatus Sericytochromatia bacterium]
MPAKSLMFTAALALGALGLVLAPAASSAKDAPDPAPKFEAKAFYGTTCAGCHGAAGEGGFGPSLQKAEAKGDKFIAERIKKGSPKGMPPYAEQLSAADVKALTAFVKKL